DRPPPLDPRRHQRPRLRRARGRHRPALSRIGLPPGYPHRPGGRGWTVARLKKTPNRSERRPAPPHPTVLRLHRRRRSGTLPPMSTLHTRRGGTIPELVTGLVA